MAVLALAWRMMGLTVGSFRDLTWGGVATMKGSWGACHLYIGSFCVCCHKVMYTQLGWWGGMGMGAVGLVGPAFVADPSQTSHLCGCLKAGSILGTFEA
jgi:hypothetical protein